MVCQYNKFKKNQLYKSTRVLGSYAAATGGYMKTIEISENNHLSI